MKVLVTGGLGYIGSHTVVELIDNNSYRPTSKEAEKYSLDNSKIARILRQFKKVKSMVIKT